MICMHLYRNIHPLSPPPTYGHAPEFGKHWPRWLMLMDIRRSCKEEPSWLLQDNWLIKPGACFYKMLLTLHGKPVLVKSTWPATEILKDSKCQLSIGSQKIRLPASTMKGHCEQSQQLFGLLKDTETTPFPLLSVHFPFRDGLVAKALGR